MVPISQSLAAFVILVVVIASIYGWICFARDRTIGNVPVPYEPRRPVAWGLLDLISIMLAVVFVQLITAAIASMLLGASLSSASLVVWMAISQVALFVAWAGVMGAMRFRSPSPLEDLGLTIRKSDFRVGAFAFAMMAPPMFALQALLSQFTDKQHPLIESLIKDSDSTFFVVAGFSAVVVAPIVEEFIFRVFLQGWLENLAAYKLAKRNGAQFRAGFGVDLFWGLGIQSQQSPIEPIPNAGVSLDSQSLDSQSLDSVADPRPAVDASSSKLVETSCPAPGDSHHGTDSHNPDASPAAGANQIARQNHASISSDPAEQPLPMRPAWWPILVSSLVFAAAHIGNGPDPIPLFFLAVGLGLLYQRTHRVWPCITVHCLLNGLSLFNLWIIVNSPELADQLLK